MTTIPKIKSVMTPFPFSIDVGETVLGARVMMEEHGVRHLPVKDGASLVGVITDRDVKMAMDPGLQLPPPDELRVGDVCRLETYVVGMAEPLDKVVVHMAKSRIGSALVVKEDRLVGIFTTTDACRFLGDLLRGECHTDNDAA